MPTSRCKQCGRFLRAALKRRGRPPVYCSQPCRAQGEAVLNRARVKRHYDRQKVLIEREKARL